MMRDSHGRFAPRPCCVEGCTNPVERWSDGKPRPRCTEHRQGHAAALFGDLAAIEAQVARRSHTPAADDEGGRA